MKIFSSFACGDLLLLYFREEDIFGLGLIPVSLKEQLHLKDKTPESMIQFKLSGTPFNDEARYTLRNSPCVEGLKFLSQKKHADKVVTRFQYGDGLLFDHVAELHDGWIRVWLEVKNQSGLMRTFDSLASFSLGMISPFENGKYYLERVTERWHHEEISMERAGMERPNSLRFGSNGTMPVVQYYPFAGIEDRSNGVLWGTQLENSGAWMLEFGSSGSGMSISGGIPDLAFCGHSFSVLSGKTYKTPSAVLTCVKGDILDLFNRLQLSQRSALPDASPIYNGPFSAETLQFLKNAGIRYYVLDHGLNAEETGQIVSAGLIPGVTMDIETLPLSKAGSKILTQNGLPLQIENRLFADHHDPKHRSAAIQELCEKLKAQKIGYVKFVCPASFCGGCDGDGSPLENQQQYTESVFEFYAELKQRMPELVLEFSTNGIGRLSAKWLTLADVVTTLDKLPAPVLAMAALDWQMLTPGYKSGINVSVNPGDDLFCKLNASLLGRLILSGYVACLSESEKKTLHDFLAFHSAAVPVLQNGSYRLGHIIGDSCMAPTGWQVFYKNTETTLLIVLHIFSELQEKQSFDIPEKMHMVMDFSEKTLWSIQGQKLIVDSGKTGSAAFLFQKDRGESVI